jgi:hypothetical protein
MTPFNLNIPLLTGKIWGHLTGPCSDLPEHLQVLPGPAPGSHGPRAMPHLLLDKRAGDEGKEELWRRWLRRRERARNPLLEICYNDEMFVGCLVCQVRDCPSELSCVVASAADGPGPAHSCAAARAVRTPAALARISAPVACTFATSAFACVSLMRSSRVQCGPQRRRRRGSPRACRRAGACIQVSRSGEAAAPEFVSVRRESALARKQSFWCTHVLPAPRHSHGEQYSYPIRQNWAEPSSFTC